MESYAGSVLAGYSRNPWGSAEKPPSLPTQRRSEAKGTKLLHQEYDRTVQEQLADCRQAVPRTVTTVDETNQPVRCQILLYRKNRTLYKKELTLHPNGLIRKIRTFRFDPSSGFLPEEKNGETNDATFDELGYCTHPKKIRWKIEEFIRTDRYPDHTTIYGADYDALLKGEEKPSPEQRMIINRYCSTR